MGLARTARPTADGTEISRESLKASPIDDVSFTWSCTAMAALNVGIMAT